MKEYKKLLVLFWFLVICFWVDSLSPCREPCTKDDDGNSNCNCISSINKRLTRAAKNDDLHHVMSLPKRSVQEGKKHKKKVSKKDRKSKSKVPKRLANETKQEVIKRSANETGEIKVTVLNPPQANDTMQPTVRRSELAQNNTIESRILATLQSPNGTAQNSSITDSQPKILQEEPAKNVTDKTAANNPPTASLLSVAQAQKVVKRDVSTISAGADEPLLIPPKIIANAPTVVQESKSNLSQAAVNLPEQRTVLNLSPSNATQETAVPLDAENITALNARVPQALNDTTEQPINRGGIAAERALLSVAANATENIKKLVKRDIQEDLNITKLDEQTINRGLNVPEYQPSTAAILNWASDQNVTSNITETGNLTKIDNQNVTQEGLNITKRDLNLSENQPNSNATVNLTSNTMVPLDAQNIMASNASAPQALNDTAEQPINRGGIAAERAFSVAANATENIKKLVKRDIQEDLNITKLDEQKLNLGLNVPEYQPPSTAAIQNWASDQNVTSNINVTGNLTKIDNQNVTENVGKVVRRNAQNVPNRTVYSISHTVFKRSISNDSLNIQVPSQNSSNTGKLVTFNLTETPEKSAQVDNRELLLNISDTPDHVALDKTDQKQPVKRQISSSATGSDFPTNKTNTGSNRGLMLEDPEHLNNKSIETLQNATMYVSGTQQQAVVPGVIIQAPVEHRREEDPKAAKVRRYIDEKESPLGSINNVNGNNLKSIKSSVANVTEITLNLTQAEKETTKSVEYNQHKNITCCNTKRDEPQTLGISIQTTRHNCTMNNCLEEQTAKTNLTIIINGRVRRDVRKDLRVKTVPNNKTKKKSTVGKNKKSRGTRPQKKRKPIHNNTKREVSANDTDPFPKHIVELREANFTVTNFTGPAGNTLADSSGNASATTDGKVIRKRASNNVEAEKKSKSKKGCQRNKRSIVDNLPQINELESEKLLQIFVEKNSNESAIHEQSTIMDNEVIAGASVLSRKLKPEALEMDLDPIGSNNNRRFDFPTIIKIDVENKTENTESPSFFPKVIQSDDKEQGGYQHVLDNLKKGYMAVGCGCPMYHHRFLDQKLAGPVMQGTVVSLPKGSPDFVKEVMCSTTCCQLNNMYSKVEKEIVCHGIREWERTDKSLIAPHPGELWEAENVVICSFLSEGDGATIEYLLSWLRIIVIYIVGILLILVLICLYLTCFLRPFKELNQSKKMDLVRLVVNKKCDTVRTQQGYAMPPKV